MRILADENIPYVRDAFATLGDVETLSGRAMTPEIIRDADLLLIRSITKVNAALLDGSRVRFVATATIGEDHVDKAYLAGQGITFASAPGSNANSVGEYVAAALLEIEQAYHLPLEGKTLGIVGVGNVGKRVLAKATALGLTCVLNDPPLERATGDPRYRPIEEVLACDFVTTHVPLTKTGGDATFHLIDEAFLARMKPGAVLINSARGAVADGWALLNAIASGHLTACVLDVWEGEPEVNVALLDEVFIGTPHIAGYSFDGKVNGTRMIYEAACCFLGVSADWDPAPLLPEPECPALEVRGGDSEAVRESVRAVYAIRRDDAAMRTLLTLPEPDRAAHFDRLRKQYPRRREFHHTRVQIVPGNAKLSARLAGLGFQIAPSQE